VSSATLLIALDKHPATVHHRLFVGTDGAFIPGTHFFAFPPLPVVVAIIVDLLDRDRGLRWDVIREIVRSLFDLVLICRLLEMGLSFLVLGERFSVRRDVSELLRVRLVEGVDDLRRGGLPVGTVVRRTSTLSVLTNTDSLSIVLLVKTIEQALGLSACNTTRNFFIYKFRTMLHCAPAHRTGGPRHGRPRRHDL